MRTRFWSLFLLVCCFAPNHLTANDYFVRGDGDDAQSGLTPDAAWRAIQRVNQARFQHGDRVLFEANKSFPGNLRLAAGNAGGSNALVVVSSFGEGRATILTSKTTGITVVNIGGVLLENLVVAGAGRTNNTGYGILCDNTLTNGQRLKHLCIQNVEVRGFGIFGILVSGQDAGFDHVRITNCVLHDNLRGGMEVAGRLPWDSPRYAHADVRVSHCQAYDNTGDPTYLKNHSGSGIVLYQVDGGAIEQCRAWNNGTLCRSQGGGVGLWTCASRQVVIEHCESFANKTSGADGGGFDIDGGSVDCTLQYNYSHDNDGPGLMVYTYPYASYTDRGNVVRFNISENDSRRSRRYAGLWVRTDGPRMTGIEIYNNTVLIGPWSGQAAYVQGSEIDARLRNNLFVSKGTAIPVRVEQPGRGVRFENNLYWREGGPVQVAWGEETYRSLSEWREHTGQERFNGEPAGFFEDPFLKDHPPNGSGDHYLDPINALRPSINSPACAGGVDLRGKLGLDVGCCDFSRVALAGTGPFFLGAISGRTF